MTTKTFLMDDDPMWTEYFCDSFNTLTNGKSCFVAAQNVSKAKEILGKYRPGELFPLVFDLCVPEAAGDVISTNEHWRNGFDSVQAAWDLGHKAGLYIISAFADDDQIIEYRKELDKRGIHIEKFLSKTHDLKFPDGFLHHFGSYLTDLSKLIPIIWEKKRIAIVDPLQLDLLCELVQRVRENLVHNTQDLHVILLSGPPGVGKTKIAEILPIIKEQLLVEKYDKKVSIPYESLSLSTASDVFNIDDKIEMLGACNWTSENQTINQFGKLTKATSYPLRTSGAPSYEDYFKAKPNREFSGFVLLDELLNAPRQMHGFLHNIISEAKFNPIGIETESIHVGCTLVFATHHDLKKHISDEEGAGRGSISNALISRLGIPIKVPSPSNFQLSTIKKIFEKFSKPLSPSASSYIEDAMRLSNFDFRDIHRAINAAGNAPRITDDIVKKIINKDGTTPHKHSPTALKDKTLSVPEKWPPSISINDLKIAIQSWANIQKSNGVAIDCKITTVPKTLNISASACFAILIIAYADHVQNKISKTQFNKWFGIHGSNKLRNRLDQLSNIYPEIFIGSGTSKSGKKPVRIKDLKEWSKEWLKINHSR